MITSRLLEPGSKPATARALDAETRHSMLGELLGLEAVEEDKLYEAMGWLLPRQAAVESALAQRHLFESTLVLYDVTSTYFEGHSCPLAKFGDSRDERRNNPQIIFGVLSNEEGCPDGRGGVRRQYRYKRDQKGVDAYAHIDGIYVLRTSVPSERSNAEQTVLAYKRLATVERAFRSLKSVDLHIRPIHHRLPDRVKAHVLIYLLAHYVEWHMRRALAPALFDDENPGQRPGSPVAPAERSVSAQRKVRTKRTADSLPVESFQDSPGITCSRG